MGQSASSIPGPRGLPGTTGAPGAPGVVDYSTLETKVTTDPNFQTVIAGFPALMSAVTTALGSNPTLTQNVSSAITTALGGSTSFQANIVALLQSNSDFKTSLGSLLSTALVSSPAFTNNIINLMTTNPVFKGITDFGALTPAQLNQLVSTLTSQYLVPIVSGLASSPTFQAAITSAISSPNIANLFQGIQGIQGVHGEQGVQGQMGPMTNIFNGINIGSNDTINKEGAWIQWNREQGGLGKTYIINQQGQGGGGIVLGTSDTSNNLTHILDIDSDGSLGMKGKGSILRFAGPGDNGHGLAHQKAFPDGTLPHDGPFLWGWDGGQLGTNQNGAKVALHWDAANVAINGDLYVPNTTHFGGAWSVSPDASGNLNATNSGSTGALNVNGDLHVTGKLKLGNWSLSQDENQNLKIANQNGSYAFIDLSGSYGTTGDVNGRNFNANGDVNGKNFNANGDVNGNNFNASGNMSTGGRITSGNDVVARNGLWMGNGVGNPGAWHLYPADNNQDGELWLSNTYGAPDPGREIFAFSKTRGNIWTSSRTNFI